MINWEHTCWLSVTHRLLRCLLFAGENRAFRNSSIISAWKMIPYYIRAWEKRGLPPLHLCNFQVNLPPFCLIHGKCVRFSAPAASATFATFGSSGSIRLFSVRLRVAKCASQRTGNYIQMQKAQPPNRGRAMLKHEECIRIQSIQLNLLKQKLSNNTNQKLKE